MAAVRGGEYLLWLGIQQRLAQRPISGPVSTGTCLDRSFAAKGPWREVFCRRKRAEHRKPSPADRQQLDLRRISLQRPARSLRRISLQVSLLMKSASPLAYNDRFKRSKTRATGTTRYSQSSTNSDCFVNSNGSFCLDSRRVQETARAAGETLPSHRNRHLG